LLVERLAVLTAVAVCGVFLRRSSICRSCPLQVLSWSGGHL